MENAASTVEVVVMAPRRLGHANEIVQSALVCGLTCKINTEERGDLDVMTLTAWGSNEGCERLLSMYRVPGRAEIKRPPGETWAVSALGPGLD